MRILITGDFCPLHRAKTVLEERNITDVFDGTLYTLIRDADFSITNLEAPLVEEGVPIIKTGPCLKLSESMSEILRAIGFNVVTLANNHIMDYGASGLRRTLDLLSQREIRHVGAGEIGREFDVIYLDGDGLRIAIVNCCENEWSTDEFDSCRANGLSEVSMFYSIRKAKMNADKVIVIHHGGHEYFTLPSPRMKRMFRYFVDCGADVVVNHHTHCLSGYELYCDRPIYYSLGNFVFDDPSRRNDVWNYGAALLLDIQPEEVSHRLIFFEQFNVHPTVAVIERERLPFDLDLVNGIIADDERLTVEFQKFIRKRSSLYKVFLEPLNSRLYSALFSRGFLPSLWSKKKKMFLKNLLSCESHREVVQTILKEDASNS